MSNPQFRPDPSAVSRAMAERERGRQLLNKTTTAICVASVAVAGVLMALLPGPTQASTGGQQSTTGSGGSSSSSSGSGSGGSSSGSSGSSGSGSSGSSSSNSGSSGGLNSPSSTPTQTGGAPVSTSGGS